MNKQFSIDSFLDWEGLHWDFSASVHIRFVLRLHSDAEASDRLINIFILDIKANFQPT